MPSPTGLPPRFRGVLAAGLASLLATGLACAADSLPAAASSQPAKPSVSTHQAMKPGQPRMAQPVKAESTPTWTELTPPQRAALEPLAASWPRMSESQKRKWLAVSTNFPAMPAGERARLHSRMAEWAALSPQQRNQARLNFAETQSLPVDDKRAKWEAYQALTPEEKKRLAAGASKPVPPTAAAVHPVPSQKLASVPKPRNPDERAPRIAVAPEKIDHNTLLPQPGTLPTSQP